MGCRQKEQTPEENEIFISFHKMMKETVFDYTIKGYEKNYELILMLSKNKFKKLEKKQNVRIGFVKEVTRYISKINIGEKEDHNTHKILFCTLILTLTLKHFLKENANNYNIRSNNDLQQSLLTMAIQILNHNFENKENLKLIIYYFMKMLVLLFKEMNDINQYINIEAFIEKINYVTEDNEILKDKEKYNFLKINLACLGEFFIQNYQQNDLEKKYIKIIIDYILYVFWENSSFVGKNYNIYKKEIFSENYLFNINEIILEREKQENYLMNQINRKKSMLSIKLVDNLISKRSSGLNDENDQISASVENLMKMRRNQSFLDLNQINDNFYFFFKSVIYDITSGKKIFNIYFNHIENFINSKKENIIKNEISDFEKTNEILLLLLFVKCKINSDNVIIFSFIEFEGEFMENNFNKRKLINEFISIFFELFKDEKEIYNRNLKLLSQIFLIEIEKLEENEEFLIEIILNKPNQLELFISFLSNLTKMLKDDEYDIESITYTLDKIEEIFDNLINKANSTKKNRIEKFMLKKEEFEILFKFINLKIKNNETIEGKENFNSQLNYFIKLLSFIDYYFSLTEVYEDIDCRNLLYRKIISTIIKLLMLNIEENNSVYINELISLVKHLINIIKKNTLNFFVDFDIIHKYLNQNLNKISKIEKEEINIIDFKLIYSVIIFIIIQLKVIYGIPTSMTNLHKEIIKEIGKENDNYKKYFDDINIDEYQNNNTSGKNNKSKNNKFYQFLSKFSDVKNKEKKILLKNEEFKYLINIIQSQLCGKNSTLIIYYKSQGNKINILKTKEGILETNENLNIDEFFDDLVIDEERNNNDILILSINESSNLIDMSLRTKKNDISEAEDGSEENSYFNDNNSQNIKLPERDEDEIEKKIDITSDLDSSFKEEKSMRDFKI